MPCLDKAQSAESKNLCSCILKKMQAFTEVIGLVADMFFLHAAYNIFIEGSVGSQFLTYPALVYGSYCQFTSNEEAFYLRQELLLWL